MSNSKFIIGHLFLFIIVAFLSLNPWPFLLLTIAQLLYVPLVLRMIIIKGDWFASNYYYFAVPAYFAIAILQITSATIWDVVLAGIYLVFTIAIAVYGITRFLQRGFTNLEEFAIDCGLVYLALGGAWYFAFEVGIDTGFSPLLTWLTGIHFHYSAFLLPIFLGLLGRINKHSSYIIICSILLISPMIVAIGITFSRWIELLSVILYIIGLYGLIYLIIKTPFQNKLQRTFIMASFTSLCVTIIFSFLYALGNGFGLISISIDFMLLFHGLLNCIAFALLGVIGWALALPPPVYVNPKFPLSKVRGKGVIGEKVLENLKHNNKPLIRGLVDSMNIYEPQINCKTLSPCIIDFYENTSNYSLFASVKWHIWFKPFAYFYSFFSKKVKQINLPLTDEQIEMTGNIYPLRDDVDGRDNVRAWMRKIRGNPAFIALYSAHIRDDRTYMNIALPLPFSTMIGILELNQVGYDLELTSKRNSSLLSDAGVYLSAKSNHLFKLPLEEIFHISQTKKHELTAKHRMKIFGIPFLTILYDIQKNE